MEGTDRWITENPTIVVGGFTLLWATLTWVWAALRWFVKREFRLMEEHQKRQDASIQEVERRLNKYDVHFAVSQESFDNLVEKIDAHIEREEDQVKKIEDIRLAVAAIEGLLKNG